MPRLVCWLLCSRQRQRQTTNRQTNKHQSLKLSPNFCDQLLEYTSQWLCKINDGIKNQAMYLCVSRALHLIKNVCLNYVQTIRAGRRADGPDRHFRNLRLEFFPAPPKPTPPPPGTRHEVHCWSETRVFHTHFGEVIMKAIREEEVLKWPPPPTTLHIFCWVFLFGTSLSRNCAN